mmetsp:Transcript_16566/g.14377  ORF Transcript_16566/g.14377 Transcript_16566/m.14377 type:complete len:108 (-) Transcript_16566:9-332(-)
MPLTVSFNRQQPTATWIKYWYYTFPEISELIPNKGPCSGGTLVDIKGKMLSPFKVSHPDFYNTTFVRFGYPGRQNIRVNLTNNTHARVISPSYPHPGRVPVEITFNN